MQLVTNSFLNLDTLFQQLNSLRFNGRKLIETLLNQIEERRLIAKQGCRESPMVREMVFEPAEKSCLEAIGAQMAKFQSAFLEPYIASMDKVSLNTSYLNKIIEDGKLGEDKGGMLVLELVQLGLDLGGSYQKQLALILREWGQLELTGSDDERLRELMLHVGFESQVEESSVICWHQKLAAFSNQRYNPKK